MADWWEMGTGLRHRASRLLLTIAALVLAVTSPALALQSDSDPSSLDDLFDLFDVAGFPADFVIAIDTSGSMSSGDDPPYPAVLDSYVVLIDSIPDGDFVSVVAFDSDPNLVFQRALDATSRDTAKTALPETADGTHTDIGAAIEATLRRLERADSSEVQTVIFITDGLHEPPPGSAYPQASGPAWDELRVRALEVADTHALTVLGIGLVEGTDVALLRSVFVNPEIVSLPPEQLPDFFEEAVRQSQLTRLARRVERELDHGVRVRSNATEDLESSIETSVTLHSSFTTLPVTVTISEVTATTTGGAPVTARLTSDEPIRIEPGGTADVAVLLKPDVSDPPFTVPPETESAEFTITLDAAYEAEPAALLRRVTTAPLSGVVTGAGTVETARTYGWSILRTVVTGVAILLLLLLLWWLYRRFLQLPRLVGVFELDMPSLDDKERIVRLKGKRMNLDASNVPLAQTAKLRLFTRRGRPGHVYASVTQPPFYEIIGPHRERAIPDEIEIRFGDYRLGGARLQYRTRASSGSRRSPVGGH